MDVQKTVHAASKEGQGALASPRPSSLTSHLSPLSCLAAAALILAAVRGGFAAEPTTQATADDWGVALSAVQSAAGDQSRPPAERANAIFAYVKLRLLQGQPQVAIQSCQQWFVSAQSPEDAAAAAGAASLAARFSQGTLFAEAQVLAEWKPAGKSAAARAGLARQETELGKVRNFLMEISRYKPTPPPYPTSLPPWAVRPTNNTGLSGIASLAIRVKAPDWYRPGGIAVAAPAALKSPDWYKPAAALANVTTPVFKPPDWYKTVQFPLLVEEKK